jgi:hypothetical protein
MAARRRTIIQSESSYELLAGEAGRSGVESDDPVRMDVGARADDDDLESALQGLAQLRESVSSEIDGVLVARNARAALGRRSR